MAKDINLELGIDESESESETERNCFHNKDNSSSSDDGFPETVEGSLVEDFRKSIIEMRIEDTETPTSKLNSDSINERLDSELGSWKAASDRCDNSSDHSLDKYSYKDETGSIRSSATTIHPDEIKKRVRRQIKLKDTREKRKKCVAKGEASAVTRKRRNNMDTIKQSEELWE